ncbi:hypothetical protein TRVL_06768 [Trypanosoma vivax]|nr:hypothetical protein TRVL_06768 [Trypanosoma vivax]
MSLRRGARLLCLVVPHTRSRLCAFAFCGFCSFCDRALLFPPQRLRRNARRICWADGRTRQSLRDRAFLLEHANVPCASLSPCNPRLAQTSPHSQRPPKHARHRHPTASPTFRGAETHVGFYRLLERDRAVPCAAASLRPVLPWHRPHAPV